MIYSIAIILLIGLIGGEIATRLYFPRLVGFIIVGMIVGPFALNWLDSDMLLISSDIRRIALIVILLRAGLTLDLSGLRQVGRPALLLSFLPAIFEIIGIWLLAPLLLPINSLSALVLGTVVAAVSPAVIVPRMLALIDENKGTHKQIPQMVLVGASLDDIFVIVLFSVVSSLALGEQFDGGRLLQIPTSIILGVLVGIIVGWCLKYVLTKINLSAVYQLFVLLAVSFLLVSVETLATNKIGFSGLLAVMSMGMTLNYYQLPMITSWTKMTNYLWNGAEIFLFVLVGATIDLSYIVKAGIMVVLLILLALLFRLAGVWLSLLKTPLERKEKLFVTVAYMPKATVQAAIGGLPLAMGISGGELILTVAVMAILLTAPVGAWLIDYFAEQWL